MLEISFQCNLNFTPFNDCYLFQLKILHKIIGQIFIHILQVKKESLMLKKMHICERKNFIAIALNELYLLSSKKERINQFFTPNNPLYRLIKEW